MYKSLCLSLFLVACGGPIVPPGPDASITCDLIECAIDGVCWGAEVENPANDCELCYVVRNKTGWSPKPEGSDCGAGNSGRCDGAGVCR